MTSEQPNGSVSVPPRAMRKYPCNPVLTYSSKRNESRFRGLKSQLPKANHGVYQPAPISAALPSKAEPLKDPVPLCTVQLTKGLIHPRVFADGVSPSPVVFPQN